MSNNPWIIHVKKYAKDHNIAYGCAVSEAKSTYIKQVKATSTNKNEISDLIRTLSGEDMVKLFTPTKRKSSYDLAGDREFAIKKVLERYSTAKDREQLFKRIQNYKNKK